VTVLLALEPVIATIGASVARRKIAHHPQQECLGQSLAEFQAVVAQVLDLK